MSKFVVAVLAIFISSDSFARVSFDFEPMGTSLQESPSSLSTQIGVFRNGLGLNVTYNYQGTRRSFFIKESAAQPYSLSEVEKKIILAVNSGSQQTLNVLIKEGQTGPAGEFTVTDMYMITEASVPQD